MDDLISRKALIETYCEENCGSRKCVDAMDRCVFISYVLEQPTVEAVPVVHAEWKEIGMRACGPYPTHYCSKCEGHGYDDYDFCPHCRADMRRKVQE